MTIRGKWAITLLILFGISLSLNLFIVGFAVSRFHGPARSGAIHHMLGAFAHRFPDEIRETLHDELAEIRPDMDREFREFRDARQQMFSLMRQENLDKVALEQSMADVRLQLNDVQAIGQAAVLRAIEASDAETRAEIGESGWGGWWRRGRH